MSHVWVLNVDITGHGGDYMGYVSAHASRDGAQTRLWQHIDHSGMLDGTKSDWIAASDEQCNAADITTERGTINYSITRLEMDP